MRFEKKITPAFFLLFIFYLSKNMQAFYKLQSRTILCLFRRHFEEYDEIVETRRRHLQRESFFLVCLVFLAWEKFFFINPHMSVWYFTPTYGMYHGFV